MEYLEVAVTTTPEAAEAVAARLVALGSAGVVVEDPSLPERRKREAPWDLFPDDLEVPGAFRVLGYWPAGEEGEERLTELRRFLAELPRYGLDPGRGEVNVVRREEAEWAESWKRFYHTLRFGRLVVRPSWEEYRPTDGEVVLTLDPGMAFGTGTHPTTALCLERLQEVLQGGETVVDAGTGSGILAIAAAKLGARRVVACDLDPAACRVAGENSALNGVADRVEVRHGDAGEVLGGLVEPVQLALANLVADLIVPLAPTFQAALAAGGRLLASGVTVERRDEVAQALSAAGLAVWGGRERDGWVLLEAVRPA